MILLKYLKIYLNIDLRISLLKSNHQNNCAEHLSVNDNAKKSFNNILTNQQFECPTVQLF